MDMDQNYIGDVDDTGPRTPQKMYFDGNEEKVILKWHPNPEPNVIGYNVYRKPPQEKIFKRQSLSYPTVIDPEFSYLGAVEGTAYKISAVNIYLKESALSDAVVYQKPAPANRVVVSTVACGPGDSVKVPVDLYSQSKLTQFSFTVNYDPNIATFKSVEIPKINGEPIITLESNVISKGIIQISGKTQKGKTIQPAGTLLKLVFSVHKTAKTNCPLKISKASSELKDFALKNGMIEITTKIREWIEY